MTEKIKNSAWQLEMEEWRSDIDRQLALIFCFLNEIDAKIEDLDNRLVNTNKQIIKLITAAKCPPDIASF